MTNPPFITDPLLDLPNIAHGFFTRHGGVSKGLYDSLNGGLGSDDNLDHALENRRLAASALGGGDDRICGLYQIHSNICHMADPEKDTRPQGDAIITTEKAVTCVILTADCVPVLLADPKAGMIGAAHAGWRGAQAGIIASTISAMTKAGALRQNLVAVVGPAIQQASYQVGDDLRDDVLKASPDAEGYFIKDGERWRFDLPSYVLGQLKAEGITSSKLPHDTYTDDRFFSHRRATHENTGDTGRLMAMIRLTP